MLSKHPPYNPVPYLGKLTLSAGVITDTVRLAGVEGDGGDIGDGVGVWPAATNKVTQSIPGALATTGVTKAGDAAATLTKVADSTHPFPNATADVWCLDNSAGAGDATVDFDGNATAAAHTASIWAYKTAGSPNLSIEGTSPTAISGATWARYTNTKTASLGDNLRVTAPAGAVVYFVAAQLETGSIATSFILTDGGTAARVAGDVYETVAAPLLSPTEGAMFARVRFGINDSAGVASSVLEASRADGTSRVTMTWTPTANQMNVARVGGGSNGSLGDTTPITPVIGDYATVGMGWSSTQIATCTNAAAFNTVANTTIGGAFDRITFGSRRANSPFNGNVLWAVFLSENTWDTALSVLMDSFGNNRPLPQQIPRRYGPLLAAHFYGDGTAYRYAS